jgi:hypothetical protein
LSSASRTSLGWKSLVFSLAGRSPEAIGKNPSWDAVAIPEITVASDTSLIQREKVLGLNEYMPAENAQVDTLREKLSEG